MTLLERAPHEELRVQPPEVAVPVTAGPTTGKPTWHKVVRWSAVGLAGVGVGVALGMGAVNTSDVDGLRSDVSTLQSDLATTQARLHSVNLQLIEARSGYSLAGEHLAQAPALSLGLQNEHLAQAPGR
jgi:hypothetical protein